MDFIQRDQDSNIHKFSKFDSKTSQVIQGCWFCQHDLSTETLGVLFVFFIFHIYLSCFIDYVLTLWHFCIFLEGSEVFSVCIFSAVLERVCLHLQLLCIEIDLNFSFLAALTLYSLLSYSQVFSPFHSLSGSSVQ